MRNRERSTHMCGGTQILWWRLWRAYCIKDMPCMPRVYPSLLSQSALPSSSITFLLTYPHGACNQYATNHELFRRCRRETTVITKKIVHTHWYIVIVGVRKFPSIGSVFRLVGEEKNREEVWDFGVFNVGWWSVRGSIYSRNTRTGPQTMKT